MAVQAALNLCVCERNRSSDCQTSARCSAAAEGGEGDGGGGEEKSRVQNRKDVSPHLYRKQLKTAVQQQKRAAEKIKCAGFKGFKG